MGRPSKVDRLPSELRDMIGRLRESGCTIDQILAKLRELDADIGRSGLGDYIRRFDGLRARLHASRAAAEAIMARLDEGGDDRVARLNISSLHSSVMDLMGGEDGEAVSLDPKTSKMLSETLRNLAQAARTNVETTVAIEKRTRERDLQRIEDMARQAEQSGDKLDGPELLRKIREEIYGVYE